MTHDALTRPLREWLTAQALGDPDIVELFDAMCRRLVGIGVPICRGRLVWRTLHPLFQAEVVAWNRGEAARLDQIQHSNEEVPEWHESPLNFALSNNLEVLRRELTGPNETLDFPVLHELKESGATDYLLLSTRFSAVGEGEANGSEESDPFGILVSWASDRSSGFSDDDLHGLQRVQSVFALTCKTVIQSRISSNVAATYLGPRAGRHVLDGQIRRGDGTRTSAVVWYSDMRDSTMLTETLSADSYFSMLNAYFEASAGPIIEHGGEILNFIGDAVLGIFPYGDEDGLRDAADRAHTALDASLRIAGEVNEKRGEEGLDRFRFGIGLNVGEVKFGNIGIPERLSFSAIGHAVNEVARIEEMTKSLQEQALAGVSLARLNPERWRSLGKHKLDGVLDPVELFAPKRAA